MTKEKVLGLSYAILGVYYLLQGISSMPVLWSFLRDQLHSDISIFVVSLLSLIPGLVLIKWGNSIFSKNNIESETHLFPKNWEQPIFTLALKIIGVVTIIEILPVSIKTILSAVIHAYQEKNGYAFQQFQNKPRVTGLDFFTGIIIPLTISFYLLLKSEPLAALILKKNKN
jgi:hypothetical protein